VDYASGLVYFTSRRFGSGDHTVWCVRVNPAGAPEPFSYVWSRGDLGEFDSSPVLLNGRVYVANNTGDIYSLNAAQGDGDRTFTTGDGPVKGFVFPDRDGKDIFFASNTKVFRVADENPDLTPMTKVWEWAGALNPSIVLFWREQRYVYVGGSNGTLWQLNLSFSPGQGGFETSLTLGDGNGQIGAPSLDGGVSPRLLVVGSEAGVVYGVAVPF
jgi:hypothetical protein